MSDLKSNKDCNKCETLFRAWQESYSFVERWGPFYMCMGWSKEEWEVYKETSEYPDYFHLSHEVHELDEQALLDLSHIPSEVLDGICKDAVDSLKKLKNQ